MTVCTCWLHNLITEAWWWGVARARCHVSCAPCWVPAGVPLHTLFASQGCVLVSYRLTWTRVRHLMVHVGVCARSSISPDAVFRRTKITLTGGGEAFYAHGTQAVAMPMC